MADVFATSDDGFLLRLSASEILVLRDALKLATEVYGDKTSTMRLLGSNSSYKVAQRCVQQILDPINSLVKKR